jgi:hypothetical protein
MAYTLNDSENISYVLIIEQYPRATTTKNNNLDDLKQHQFDFLSHSSRGKVVSPSPCSL